MARVTKYELEKRVNNVAELLINGYPEYRIKKILKDNYNISNRQIATYIKKARDKLQPKHDADIEEQRLLKILQIEKKILNLSDKEASTARGLNAYVNAQKLIIDLKNLMPVKKVALDNDEENPLHITWHEEKTYKTEDNPE